MLRPAQAMVARWPRSLSHVGLPTATSSRQLPQPAVCETRCPLGFSGSLARWRCPTWFCEAAAAGGPTPIGRHARATTLRPTCTGFVAERGSVAIIRWSIGNPTSRLPVELPPPATPAMSTAAIYNQSRASGDNRVGTSIIGAVCRARADLATARIVAAVVSSVAHACQLHRADASQALSHTTNNRPLPAPTVVARGAMLRFWHSQGITCC